MNLTDTHAHLHWDSFQEDFDEVIKRAFVAGVTTIINVGVDVETSQKALEQGFPTAIGIHPHESDVWIHEDIGKLEEIYQSDPSKIVAIGECGLDYKEVDEKTKKSQRQLFQAQIDLAKKLNLPLIVHCREAWDETIEMTKNHFGIYHCYSGLEQTTKQILKETGFLISFAANITYPKNEYLREAVKTIPLERIVLETDCPFLPPQTKRGQRNEPANILETAQIIARLKDITLAEVASQTTENVKGLFAF